MMDEFIKSKSMLSSGVLGTTTTMIAGTMASQFDIPGNITAIVVSFVLGLLVFTDHSIPYIQRGVFYVIISMIIFTTAMGINAAGIAATRSSESNRFQERGLEGERDKSFFHDWFSSADILRQGLHSLDATPPGNLDIANWRHVAFEIASSHESARSIESSSPREGHILIERESGWPDLVPGPDVEAGDRYLAARHSVHV